MEKIHIEICEPEGNAFWLLGLANELAIKAGRDPRPILRRMKSRDYRHLLNVLQREFGELLVLTDRGVVIPRPTGARRQAPSGATLKVGFRRILRADHVVVGSRDG